MEQLTNDYAREVDCFFCNYVADCVLALREIRFAAKTSSPHPRLAVNVRRP